MTSVSVDKARIRSNTVGGSGVDGHVSLDVFFCWGKKKNVFCGGAIRISVDLMLVPLRRLL
ncbi:hypothetical protein, partial [Pseudomonas aeruginosa]|uniref:hypothetical protein n=1 Tax=Pseudomonas aeruginosa TaxID=287 RepID=UPI0031B6BF43